MVKNLPAKAGEIRNMGSISGSGRSPGGGRGNSLQYSCLENPIDRGALRATVHYITESDTTEGTWPSGNKKSGGKKSQSWFGVSMM